MSSARPTLDVPTLQSCPCEAAGFARAAPFPPDIAFSALFSQLEKETQAAARGLWSACPMTTPTATPQHRALDH